MSDRIADYAKLNTAKEVKVRKKDLPLYCPSDESAVWCSHPRVCLPIEGSKGQQIRCPYCGTLYRLEE